MKLSKVKLAVIALIVANLIWGAASPIYKWALSDVHPMTLGFLRFFLSACVLYPFLKGYLKIERKDFTRVASMSLLGITFHISLLLIGLTLSASVNAPVVGSAAPVFLIIASAIFLGDRLKMKVFIGMMLSLIGVLIIILRPIFEHGLDSSVFGNVLFILSTFGNVGYTIMMKNIAKRYNSLSLTFWTFLIGSLGFFPFFTAEIFKYPLSTQFHIRGIIGLLFSVLFASIIAYALNNYAIKYLVTSEVGIFMYMDPVVAILVAIPLLGESITYFFFMGSILVFLGIFIAEGRIHYHPFHLLSKREP